MGSRKGDKWERNFRNYFDEIPGFTAVRMPASGGGIDADLPDLHVWYNDGYTVWQYAFEVKAFGERTSLSGAEVDALCNYANAVGAFPAVLTHVDRENQHDDVGGDYVFPIDELHTTKSGNYSITKHRDVDDATTFEDFVESPAPVSRRRVD